MNRPYLVSILGSFITFAVAGGAQTGAVPAEPARLTPALRGGDGPKVTPTSATAEKPEKRAKGPTEITAVDATFDNRAHMATFTGSVVVKDPEFNVTCDAMTVYLKKPPETAVPNATASGAKPTPGTTPKPANDSESGIEKAIAEGNVIITQDKIGSDGKLEHYVGTGRKAIYETGTGNVTLYGSPTVEQRLGGSMSKKIVAREDGCVMVLNRAGKIDVKGLHTTTLQDTSSLDKK